MLLQTILLGLTYALAPGPVMIETVRRSIRGGARSAAAVQCGAVAAELIFALLFISGLGRVLLVPGVKLGLALLGAALLVYLGASMVFDQRGIVRRLDDARSHDGPRTLRESLWRPVGVGLMLMLFNPYSLVFWFSVGNTTFGASLAGLGGFLAGVTLGCAIVALLAGRLGSPQALRRAIWLWSGCAALMVLFGLQLGYTALFAGGAL